MENVGSASALTQVQTLNLCYLQGPKSLYLLLKVLSGQ